MDLHSPSAEERHREYERFLERRARRYRTGRAIVATIAALNVLAALVSAVTDLHIRAVILLIVQFVLSFALLIGVAWVRYLFVIGAGLNAAALIGLLPEYGSELTGGTTVLLLAEFAVFAASALLLLFHSGVKEFLYKQKNG